MTLNIIRPPTRDGMDDLIRRITVACAEGARVWAAPCSGRLILSEIAADVSGHMTTYLDGGFVVTGFLFAGSPRSCVVDSVAVALDRGFSPFLAMNLHEPVRLGAQDQLDFKGSARL